MTSCSLTTFSLSSRLSYAPAPLTFRRTLREVLLDIYSRTSCSWRSLSPNFPENWKNMLLNAFLLTYVLEFCYSFQWKITRSEPLSHSLSLSLSYVLHTFSFSAGQNRWHPCASAPLRFALCISSKNSRHSPLTMRSCSQLRRSKCAALFDQNNNCSYIKRTLASSGDIST